MINERLTGHVHYKSALEMDDSCGTCDGARCDSCMRIYEVEGVEGTYDDLEDAKDAEKKYLDECNSLFPESSLPEHHSLMSDRFYTIIDDVLCLQVWKKPSFKGDTDYGYKYLPCNQESPMYGKEFEEAKKRLYLYEQCTCIDKDNECKFGCTDSSCYYEMKYRNRKEKKWYM